MAVNVCCCVELSPNKKSIFGLRMKSQILYFVLFIGFLVSVSAADSEMSCANVKTLFEKKGMLAMIDLQEQPNSDAGELCANKGCCGPAARPRLTQQARIQLEGQLRSELTKLADVLGNKAKKFDEFFRKLLQLSREEFHAMFKRTYGMIYEQHSYVFVQLFEQLERYYTRGDTDFDSMMDSFFGILYQKMFTVLNSQYSFDDKYLKCVSEHMRDIQPFEDVPSKLSVQLRRAFVATRTFHKALRAGADVVRNMVQVGVSQECVTAWARLRYCGTCAGDPTLACSRYCHNVIRGCLPAHADLSEQWDAYVDAVEKVADRLLGPFNIAMVVGPIDIKISEAIMSFQERNQEISQKIFSGCGKPVLGGGGSSGPFFAPDRTRRFARSLPEMDWNKANDVDDFVIETSLETVVNNDPSLNSLRTPEDIKRVTEEMEEQAKSRSRFLQYMRGDITLQQYEEHEREREKRDADPEPAGEIDYRSYEFDGKRGSKKKKPATKVEESHGAEGGPALERLVRETRARVRSSRRYWAHLPALLCASASITSAPCFNGTHVAAYTAIAAGDGSTALASNPEVRGTPPPSSVARTQLDSLKTLTARLKDAYNGVEVQWKDSAEDLQAAETNLDLFESAGSGSGSGDHIDDNDDLPDDDEDRDAGNDYPEGSGDHQTDTETTDIDTHSQTPISEVPNIIDSPAINNGQPRLRTDLTGPDDVTGTGIGTDIDIDTNTDTDISKERTPVREQPVASAADRPSLQNALFSYALPVVCAWFGTIVTDLF
ncbi:glypican-4 [Colias croceus]|uniref:glypican-4 n=1 Tax=Colias crocea TaxID=72248 RepID=UPI001E27C38D|nr:glypican-4 [Colias croceus]